MAKVTILGAGGWGMALSLVAYSKNHDVTVWTPFKNEAEQLSLTRTNSKLLQGIYLNNEIKITSDISYAENSDITIIAVPSVAVKETAVRLKKVKNFGILVNVAKGFDAETNGRLSQIINSELPDAKVVVLSGPSHAEEVARNRPTTVVVASSDTCAAKKVQELLATEPFRIYTSNDIIGVEIGGALKNVIAVCAGICDGLGLGDNTKAAVMTRGLSEMARLGVLMGAKESTFLGLSGIGDLIVTCLSEHSRNNRFGKLVGGGLSVENALTEVGTVEGYYAAKLAFALAQKYGIELPVIEQCYKILYESKSAETACRELLSRPPKAEKI